jgi:hypothetical protein
VNSFKASEGKRPFTVDGGGCIPVMTPHSNIARCCPKGALEAVDCYQRSVMFTVAGLARTGGLSQGWDGVPPSFLRALF